MGWLWLGVVLGTLFLLGLMRMRPLPELLLDTSEAELSRAGDASAADGETAGEDAGPVCTPRTDLKPSDVPLNSGEGLRAAYYVDYDPASYSSLKQHVKQIDLLFADWLHVV